MKRLLEGFTKSNNGSPSYVVSSAHPRLVDGEPSKNPRNLQKLPDVVAPRETVLASDWYEERLFTKQERDKALWQRHTAALEKFRAGRGPWTWKITWN
jgi:hypothetical protein